MGSLGETVNHCENGGLIIQWRDASNAIQGYVGPGKTGDRKGVEQPKAGLYGGLDPSTDGTTCDEGPGVGVNSGPPEA